MTKKLERSIIRDYKQGIVLDDITAKYSTGQTQIYRILNKYNVKRKELTEFGSDIDFKNNYTTLSKFELVKLYGTNFNNIKAKAARLGIKRPRGLVKYNSGNIFLAKKDWLGLSEAELANLEERIFRHYRKSGFPYLKLSLEEKLDLFNNVKNFDVSNSIVNNVVSVLDSNFLADSYFPNMYEVKCHNIPKSTLDLFNDDTTLRKVINSRIKYAERIADNTIRRGMKYVGQSVSNFKPKSAKSIYAKYGGENGVVWDMSMGWGGRLIGALASPNISKYIGTDPNSKNKNGYLAIYDDFKHLSKCEVEFNTIGSEDYKPIPDSLDLCFTSPPYFDTEKYSEETTQSYLKYSTKELWLNGFLRRTFENCMTGLKTNGYMLINIADVKSYKNLVEDTIKTAVSLGFIHENTLQYQMGQTMFKKSEEKKFRYEPILVFKKKVE